MSRRDRSSVRYCGTKFYDELIQLDYPDGVNIVCFADDVAVIITRNTTWLLEMAMNDTLQIVAAWMKR